MSLSMHKSNKTIYHSVYQYLLQFAYHKTVCNLCVSKAPPGSSWSDVEKTAPASSSDYLTDVWRMSLVPA